MEAHVDAISPQVANWVAIQPVAIVLMGLACMELCLQPEMPSCDLPDVNAHIDDLCEA